MALVADIWRVNGLAFIDRAKCTIAGRKKAALGWRGLIMGLA
jgi:hypothetical protein